MTEPLRKIFQIKISLTGAKPPIWRRILITNSTDLSKLHDIIQTAMGWTDTHLHQFIAEESSHGVPDADWEDGTISENGVRIGSLLKNPKDHIIYEYDFGDGWEHRLELEEILPFTSESITPVCTAGTNCCPPEDVGGVWGYSDFLEAYRNKEHPEHENMREWIGGFFDPEEFDLDEINQILLEEHGTA